MKRFIVNVGANLVWLFLLDLVTSCSGNKMNLTNSPAKGFQESNRPSEESEGLPGYFARCQYLTTPSTDSAEAIVQCKVDNVDLSEAEIRNERYTWIVDPKRNDVTVTSTILPQTEIFQQQFIFQGTQPLSVLDSLKRTEISVIGDSALVVVAPKFLKNIASNAPSELNESPVEFTQTDSPITVKTKLNNQCLVMGQGDDDAKVLGLTQCALDIADQLMINRVIGKSSTFNISNLDGSLCLTKSLETIGNIQATTLVESDCLAGEVSQELAITAAATLGSWTITDSTGMCLTSKLVDNIQAVVFEACSGSDIQMFQLTSMSMQLTP